MPLWDPAVLTDAVAAVHEAGARIAVHAFSHRVIDSLIEAGVDDIEHGSGIDANQAREIAARGIAVTPTLRQVELFKDFAAQAGAKYPVYAATMQAMYDERRSHFEMLVDSGVLLLMGNRLGGATRITARSPASLICGSNGVRPLSSRRRCDVGEPALPRLPRPRRGGSR